MPNNWKKYKLDDVLESLIDYRGKTPTKTTFGIPLITAKIVKNGTIEEPNEFIAESDYDTWMTRGFPRVGDVVLTTEAPLGEVAQIKTERFALAQRIVTLRGKNGILDNGFLKYFLQSPIGQKRLIERETGTTVTGIKQSELRLVEIACPPLPEQQVIAEILSSLDDKIELNLQTNKTLGEMANALYKHWFVDFGPFQNGKFVKSELGMIPVGWEVKNLGEIVKFNYGKALKESDRQPGSFPVYGSSGVVGSNNTYLIEGPSIIVGRKGNVGSIFWEYKNSFPIDTAYYIKHTSLPILRYSFFALKSIDFKSLNSDSVVPGLNRDNAESQKVLFPVKEVLNDFYSKVNPLFISILETTSEIELLRQTRDYLLPKLISGEIEVKQAAKLAKQLV